MWGFTATGRPLSWARLVSSPFRPTLEFLDRFPLDCERQETGFGQRESYLGHGTAEKGLVEASVVPALLRTQ